MNLHVQQPHRGALHSSSIFEEHIIEEDKHNVEEDNRRDTWISQTITENMILISRLNSCHPNRASSVFL